MSKTESDSRPRAPAHHAERADGETPGESLSAHALRVVRTRVKRAIGGLLRPIIAALQRVLARVDPAPQPVERRDQRGSAAGRQRGHEPEPEAEAEVPEPHRLRTFLLYLLVLILGGLGGGALGYQMFERMLEKRTADAQRLESTMSKQAKSADTSKKKLEEAQAKLADLEKKPSEAEANLAQAEKKLAEEQSKRAELETQLKALQTEHSKALVDQQKKLAEAVKLLDSIRGTASAARPVSSPPPSRPPKTGDCTVGSTSVGGLKDCVEKFNR